MSGFKLLKLVTEVSKFVTTIFEANGPFHPLPTGKLRQFARTNSNPLVRNELEQPDCMAAFQPNCIRPKAPGMRTGVYRRQSLGVIRGPSQAVQNMDWMSAAKNWEQGKSFAGAIVFSYLL